MRPLLKIQTIPISIEYSTKRAALQHSSEPPRVNVTRNRGSASIRTTPAQIHLDTTEARASRNMKSPARSIHDFGQEGLAAAQEATRAYAEDGNAILDAHGKGSPIADISAKRAFAPPPPPTFGTVQQPEITPERGSISFDYHMDKLTFDWNTSAKPQLEYVPYSLEFSVQQYPELVIEYVGSPIYVPPSADPNYVPPPGIDENA